MQSAPLVGGSTGAALVCEGESLHTFFCLGLCSVRGLHILADQFLDVSLLTRLL